MTFAFLFDYAQESGGKLSALGIGIDQIQAPAVPTTQPTISVVVSFLYQADEVGTTAMSARFIDADGNNIVPPIEGHLMLTEPVLATGIGRLVLQLNSLQFQR